jgi:hypothetical protein
VVVRIGCLTGVEVEDGREVLDAADAGEKRLFCLVAAIDPYQKTKRQVKRLLY